MESKKPIPVSKIKAMQEFIDRAQGRANARTTSADEIAGIIARAENRLAPVPKKLWKGTMIVHTEAGPWANSYGYKAEATRVVLVRRSADWALTKAERVTVYPKQSAQLFVTVDVYKDELFGYLLKASDLNWRAPMSEWVIPGLVAVQRLADLTPALLSDAVKRNPTDAVLHVALRGWVKNKELLAITRTDTLAAIEVLACGLTPTTTGLETQKLVDDAVETHALVEEALRQGHPAAWAIKLARNKTGVELPELLIDELARRMKTEAAPVSA